MLMATMEIPANLPDKSPCSYREHHTSTHESYYRQDYAASMFFTVGSKLTNPICWCSSYVHRIVSPFLPGDFVFKPTVVEEAAIRGLYIIEFCLLTPVAVPLGGAGVGCRSIGACLLPDGFCYLPGKAKPLTTLKNKTLSVMTWNICGIGGSMELSHGGVADWNKRLSNIVKEIEQENPDILCLQEVHDTDLSNDLYKRLKDRYAYFYMHIGPNAFGSNSGNYVASKYPLKDFTFTEFDASIGSGKWQKKGFANFTVISDNKPLVHIVTTHLQYGELIDGRGKIIEVRNSQLSQIMYSCFHCQEKNIPVLLVGDLNIEMDSEEYEDSYLSSHFSHGYSYEEPTSTCYLIQTLWNPECNTNGLIDEKIDYISFLNKNPKTGESLKLPKLQVRLIKAYDKTEPSLARSDHHALIGNISFSKN